MSEIKVLFPPQWCVTHCDYAVIIIIMGLVDSLDYNYAIFASNAVSLESKKHLMSLQLLTFWWIFVGDGLTICLMVLQKVSQRNVRMLECANTSQPTLVHNFLCKHPLHIHTWSATAMLLFMINCIYRTELLAFLFFLEAASWRCW